MAAMAGAVPAGEDEMTESGGGTESAAIDTERGGAESENDSPGGDVREGS